VPEWLWAVDLVERVACPQDPAAGATGSGDTLASRSRGSTWGWH